MKLDYGYDEEGVYAARMGLFEGDYPTEESRREFFKRAVRSLRTNPTFEGAAMSDRFRMTFANYGQYEVDGQTYKTDRDRPKGNSEAVSDALFQHDRFEDSRGPRFHPRRQRRDPAGRDREREFCAQTLGEREPARASGPPLQSRSAATVAHDRRRRARHADAGAVQYRGG